MRHERVVLAQILAKYGSRAEIHLRRNQSGALMNPHGRLVRFGLPGSADLEGFIAPRARFIAIECKTFTGEQREAQRKYQFLVERRGGIYIIARSLEHFEAELVIVMEKEEAITRVLAEAGVK